jgi:nucleoside 2-deoxyribosyltransferase
MSSADLSTCPICRQTVDPFTFNHSTGATSVISCVRCGEFRFGEDLASGVASIVPDYVRYFAGAVRELNERGVTPQLNNPDQFLQMVRIPKNPLEMMDRFLLSLNNRTLKADMHVALSEHDFSLAYAHDLGEWMYLARSIESAGLIEFPGDYQFRIRPAGYQRLIELTKDRATDNQAFVAMNFSPSLDNIYSEGIYPALIDAGYVPLRIDRKEHNNRIDDSIMAEIRKSGLLVADFTGQRTGVYFEAGFGLGLGVPVIWCCKESEKDELRRHFDTRQYNHILWDNAADLRRKLGNRIAATAPRLKA